MYTLFLYTGYGLSNFRANVPEHFIVFVNADKLSARKAFTNKIGKEPELMGFQHVEASSKEIAWQKAIDSGLMNLDVELDVAMELDGVLVIEYDKDLK